MRELNLHRLWEICNKLSFEQNKLAEQNIWVSLLGSRSSYSAYSFEEFLDYYSFKVDGGTVTVFNDNAVEWEDYRVGDFSYIPSFLLSFGEKELNEWINEEGVRQLKQQEREKIAEKENIKLEIERLTKRYNTL